MLTTSLSIGVTLACLACVLDAAPFLRPERARPEARGTSQAHPANQETTMDPTLWAPRWPHDAPDEPLTAGEAHRTMQRHRTCLREECPRKNAAYNVLVEVGDIKPDASRIQ